GLGAPGSPTRCQVVQAAVVKASRPARMMERQDFLVIPDNTSERGNALRLAVMPGRAIPLRASMAQDPLVGRTIVGYSINNAVGEDGTAKVYQAEQPERGVVGLKVLRPRLAQDPVAVKRLLRESEFGSRVVRPNVVRTIDYGEADGVYFLALEWASGEPLELFLTRSGKLEPPVVARI